VRGHCGWSVPGEGREVQWAAAIGVQFRSEIDWPQELHWRDVLGGEILTS